MLVLLVSTLVLLLSLVGGIGVWIIRQPVMVRTSQIFGRAQAALDIVEEGLEGTRKSLTRAKEHLDSARQDQKNLNQQPQPKNAKRKALAMAVKRGLSKDIEDSQAKLNTVAEASVVVNSVLEDLGNLPLFSTFGLDQGRLTEVKRGLTGVSAGAWGLSQALDEPDGDANAAGEQLSRLDQPLETIRRLLDKYQPKVQQVRSRTKELEERTQSWVTPAAVLISALCLWIALSQFSLLQHAWYWGKARRPASA
jgi:hypothetical protein